MGSEKDSEALVAGGRGQRSREWARVMERLEVSCQLRRRVPIIKIKPGGAVHVGREDSEHGRERVELKGLKPLHVPRLRASTTSPRKPSLLLQVELLFPSLGSPRTLCCPHHTGREPKSPGMMHLWVPSLIHGKSKAPPG